MKAIATAAPLRYVHGARVPGAGGYARLAGEVGRWLASPPELREQETLDDLCRAQGYACPRKALYGALSHPEAALGILSASVARIGPDLPNVMAQLVAAAQAGSVRAADTLLRHCREVVRLSLEVASQGGRASQHLHLHLEDTARVAQDLLATAQSLMTHRAVEEAPAAPATGAESTEPPDPPNPITRWSTRTIGGMAQPKPSPPPPLQVQR